MIPTAVSFEEAEAIAEYILTGTSKLLKSKKEAPKKAKKAAPKKETEEKKEEPKKEAPAKAKETPKSPAKSTEKKEEPQAVKETTPAAKQETAKPAENKANPEKVVMKKRGLTIVKKKKPRPEPTPTINTIDAKKQKMASMSELFGNGPDLKEEYTPKPKKHKPKLRDCPFIIHQDNPCNYFECKDVDWKTNKINNESCKKRIDTYCSINWKYDPACFCWRPEQISNPQCQKWRGQFEPKDKCNFNKHDITDHPDSNQWIRKDKIPCWNCNLNAPEIGEQPCSEEL